MGFLLLSKINLVFQLWRTVDLLSRIFYVKEVNIDLNIPPFLDGCSQLTPEKIEARRKIASLRIHVERVIGRMKSFNILKGTIPISMARITNQIVCVCAFLTNFEPALIPLQLEPEESQVGSYFQQLESDCGSEDVHHHPGNLFHNLLASCFTLTYPLCPIVLYTHTHTHNTIQVCSMLMTKVNDDTINES